MLHFGARHAQYRVWIEVRTLSTARVCRDMRWERGYQVWCSTLPLPSPLPVQSGEPGVVWLSGLHIPESYYLSALLQVRRGSGAVH